MSSSKKTQQVILPPSYTTTTPAESFPDDSYGVVTWHTLFSQPLTPTSDLSAGIAVCPPRNGRLCPHRHEQAEIYHILDGDGEVIIDGVKSRVTKGSSVFIPSNAEHGIVNVGDKDLRWFYVFPTSAFENVVYRFSEVRGAKL